VLDASIVNLLSSCSFSCEGSSSGNNEGEETTVSDSVDVDVEKIPATVVVAVDGEEQE